MGPGGEGTEKTNNQIEYTEAEKAYMRHRHGMSYTRDEPYQIQDLTQELLVRGGPAVAVGEFGMAETVEERLRLLAKKSAMEGLAGRVDIIRRVMAGEFVRFENEQEKEEVLAEAERISKRDAELKSEETGEIVESDWTEFVGLEEAERKAVVESMLKGEYAIEADGAEGIMAHLMRNASRNETYLPKDGSALLEKVRSLLSTQKTRPAAKPTAVR
ncbi:MAG: hypothetical protein LQ347_005603 [Umbilicaria vellea]|nr:MAG: hypothetical protein LQ347_005603 [Umbilicaria vellea]